MNFYIIEFEKEFYMDSNIRIDSYIIEFGI